MPLTETDDENATLETLTDQERLHLLHEVFDNADGNVSDTHHTHDPDDEDAVGPLLEDQSEEE